MTAVTVRTAHRGGYRFGHVARMEWIKLRSQRYPKPVLAVMAAGIVGVGIAVGATYPAHLSAARLATFDPTETGFAGLSFGQLVVGVLGVLVMTSEYSSGLIRGTFAAIPDRRLVLAAKAAVFGGVTLAAGEIIAFGTFFAMRAALPATVPHPAFGQPGVLRAVIMAGVYLCLVGLIGVGLGGIIRHSGAAIAAVAGLLFVLPLVLLALPGSTGKAIDRFLPMIIAENSITAVKGQSPSLPVWAGLGMLCLYAAVLLSAAGWLLARRDA
jgi:ABC-type transport system involved in multi-copper enzyme maturation permease subunit